MSTTHQPAGGNDAIVVSLILEAEHAYALDALCGATLSSRAGAVRRALVSTLREEGFLPDPSGPRPVARTSLSATRGQSR